MPVLWIALLALALPPQAGSPRAGSAPLGPVQAGDEALIAAWERLDEELRLDLVARFEARVGELDTFQAKLIRHALALEPDDPGFLPEVQPIPVFDPAEHAPKKLIKRKPLKAGSSAAEREFQRLTGVHPARRYASAWSYDWGSGEVRRALELDDPERTFRNALAGVPPWLDLAEALVLRALDDGSQRKLLAAFDHAYTDRKGNVYPGLTLYDAWTSGQTMEMPDVDNLGIVHDVLGEWDRWVSPVPDSKHDSLYAEVAGLFATARAHRALRTALARTYLQAEPALRDGYEFQLDRLHALWDERSSELTALAGELPSPAEVKAFMSTAALRLERTPELIAAGRARRATLTRDQGLVRNLMLGLLAEAGVKPRAGTKEQ